MKNLIFFIFILLIFISCKKTNKKIEIETLRINETYNILESIINQESLNVIKNNKDSCYFLEDLAKLNVTVLEEDKKGIEIIPLPFFNNIEVKDLIKRKINDKLFFLENDSVTIIAQNIYPEKLKIQKSILNKLNSISYEEAKSKFKKEHISLYEMSIPIFSSDNKKAYVQLNNHCGVLCGEGVEIFLEKQNEKWRIVYKQRTWVS